MNNNKSLLFKKILPALKRQAPYFSLAAVKRVLSGSKIRLGTLSLPEQTIRKYMSEAMATGLVGNAGRGWYTRHEKVLKLDVKPVQQLIGFCCPAGTTSGVLTFLRRSIQTQLSTRII